MRTLAHLRKEKAPQKVKISEIPMKKRRGWELFVNKSDVRDIIFLNRKYYLATSGGIIVLTEDGKIIEEYNTLYGLQENSFLQLVKREDDFLCLTDGGKLINLKEKFFFSYNLKGLGKISGVFKRGNGILISASKGVYLLRKDKIQKLEDIKDVKIAKSFADGIVAGTMEGKVYITTTTFKDSIIDIDAVNDIYESGDILLIATPLGLERVSNNERKKKLEGEFITTIANYNKKLCYGTFDGRVIIGDKIERVAKKDSPINRLKLVNDKLFALTSAGIYLMENNKWRVFYKPSLNFPLTYITSLEKSGPKLLIGTFENGCFSLHSSGLHKIEIGEDVNEINQIVSEGNLTFFATNSGLFLVDKKGVKRIEGLPSHFVSSIFPKGKKIIAGTSRGFGIIDLAHLSIKNFGTFQGLINNRVYTITNFAEKVVLGTLGGISIFDGKVFKNLTSANSSLENNWINSLLTVGERVYIATYGGGLAYLDKSGIKTIEETKGIEVNHHALFYKQPFVLAGTCKNGLYVYNERKGKGKFLKGFFPLNDVTAVFADDEHFYIGTEQGLYRIALREMPIWED